MKTILFTVMVFAFISCVSVNMKVPGEFKNEATKMTVKGMDGWMFNQKLSFGNYRTSAVRRGWDLQNSVQYTKFRLNPEEYILSVYNINTDKRRYQQKNRFQYTINDGNLMTEIYATEKFTEKQLVYKSNNPWIGKVHNTTSYAYSFTAAIIPLDNQHADPWSLVILNKYDRSRNLEINYRRGDNHYKDEHVSEEGYVTNGRENFAISPLRSSTLETDKGDERRIFGGKIFTGYEIRMNNELVAAIDLFDRAVWVRNDLNPNRKLILASVASALLLKRVQDSNDVDSMED